MRPSFQIVSSSQSFPNSWAWREEAAGKDRRAQLVHAARVPRRIVEVLQTELGVEPYFAPLAGHAPLLARMADSSPRHLGDGREKVTYRDLVGSSSSCPARCRSST